MKLIANIRAMLKRLTSAEHNIRDLIIAHDNLARKLSIVSGLVDATDEKRETGNRPTYEAPTELLCLDAPHYTGAATIDGDTVTKTGRIQLVWNENHWEGGSSLGNTPLVATEDYANDYGSETPADLDPAQAAIITPPGAEAPARAYLANALFVVNHDGLIQVALNSAVMLKSAASGEYGNMQIIFHNGTAYPVAVLAD